MLSNEDRVLLGKAYNNKGLSLSKLGKHHESIECFEKAMELGCRSAFLNKGIALSDLGKDERAITTFDTLINELEIERLGSFFDSTLDELEEDIQLTMSIDETLKEVVATQKIEGLEISKETEQLIKDCLLEKISFDEAREKIFQQIKSEQMKDVLEKFMEEIEKEGERAEVK